MKKFFFFALALILVSMISCSYGKRTVVLPVISPHYAPVLVILVKNCVGLVSATIIMSSGNAYTFTRQQFTDDNDLRNEVQSVMDKYGTKVITDEDHCS